MTSGKLIVVKYGGSVLENGMDFRRAAEAVSEEYKKGTQIVVVVSALRGVTDQLLSVAKNISENIPQDVIDHIIGLGEEQSVRLMVSALKHMGVKAVEITPHSPSWPIITNERYGDAEPILIECKSGTELGVKPLIERGQVPVVCGFVGRSLDGNFTTLGRGGSDTTAVILARCLGADELVLVKDVGGVYTADPHRVKEARVIESLSAWEAYLFASSGAKVLHDKVFDYKPDDLMIRLVSKNSKLGEKGTVIKGSLPNLLVKIHNRPVVKVTILGEPLSKPEGLTSIITAIDDAGGELLMLQGSDKSLTIILDSQPKVINSVHTLVDSYKSIRAISVEDDKALISLKGKAIENITQTLQKINDVLTSLVIKNYSLITNQSQIGILVEWEKRQAVLDALEKKLGDM
jgi:aspartate kinase